MVDNKVDNDLVHEQLVKTPKTEQPPMVDPVHLAEHDNYDGLTFEVIEHERVADKTIAQKGVYLIPNSFTLLSLLAAFYSITQSSLGEGHFGRACIAILYPRYWMVLMDGQRVCLMPKAHLGSRWTHWLTVLRLV